MRKVDKLISSLLVAVIIILLGCNNYISSEKTVENRQSVTEDSVQYSNSLNKLEEAFEYNYLKRLILSGKIDGLNIDTIQKSIFLDAAFNSYDNEPLLFLEYMLLFSTEKCLSIIIQHTSEDYYFVNYDFVGEKYHIEGLGPRLLNTSIDSTSRTYVYDFESEYGLMGTLFNNRRFFVQDIEECPDLSSVLVLSSVKSGDEYDSKIVKAKKNNEIFVTQNYEKKDSLINYKLINRKFIIQ